MWQAASSLGLSLLSGASARTAQRAQNRVLDAKAKAENTIREGQNLESAAYSALAQWTTTENNRRAAKAGGEAMEAAQMTLARVQDSVASGSLEDQIQSAEAAGAYAANAAMNGTGGSSRDVIAYAIKAQQERQRVYRERNNGFATYDAMKQIAGMAAQTLDSQQLVGGAASLDKGVSLSKAQPVQGGWLLDAVTWASGNTKGAQQLADGLGGFFKPASTGSDKYSLGGTSGLGFKRAPQSGIRI